MKLCKDCEHYGGHPGLFHVCKSPRNSFIDLVTGQQKEYAADWLRADLPEQPRCGSEGRWWKPWRNEINPHRAAQSAQSAMGGQGAPKDMAAGKPQGCRQWIRALGLWPKGRDTGQQPS